MKSNLNLLVYFFFFCLPLFVSCKKSPKYGPERIKSELLPISQNTASDTTVALFIAPYQKAIKAEMDSVLAYAPKSYSKKDGLYNTAIGNMMADAVFEMANPVFKKRAGYSFNAVLLNYGGIRAPINQGPITTRTAYEIMPFENDVVVVELSGRQIKDMFQYLKEGTAHPISGIEIGLSSQGELIKSSIQGQEVLDNETYFIATSDYLMNGGDQMTFFSKPVSVLPLDYKIRTLLIDYFKKRDTIAPVRDNRFTKETK